jgi:CubicO group peptidase (beta-lactamase class C family)
VRGREIERHTLEARMAGLSVPAVSLAVLDDGLVSAKAWGAPTDTLFQAASISKPTSAVAAMRLAADGVIDLDRPVNEMLRSWQLPDADGVTLRRILSHSAGLGVHGFPGYERGTPLPTLQQILDGEAPANTEAVRVVRPPGDAYQYSGGGYTLMQLVIEDATAEPFAQTMQRVVLGPLGMRASTFEQPLPEDRHAQAATGYRVDGTPVVKDWHVYPEQAAAGLWTTPSDLLRVAEEMLSPGRVLDKALRDGMLTPHTSNSGLGWALELPWFQHGGSNDGFQCLLFASAVHGKAAAAMTNSDAGLVLCLDLMAAVAEAFDWPDFLREREAIQLDGSALDAVAGVYDLDGQAVTVKRDGDRLTISASFLSEAELFAASPTEFFRTDLDASLVTTADGLDILISGTTISLKRR